MTRGGKTVPQLASILREIAERVESGSATARDAEALRRLARQAAGEDRAHAIKVHPTRRGQQAKGATGVDQRFALACKVRDHRAKHGGTLDDAFRALNGTFGVGPESIRKAWQEMRPLLDVTEKKRDLILSFKRLQATGYAVKVRLPKG